MIPKATEKPSENKSDLSLSLYMSVTCRECKGENRHWCSTLVFQLGFGLSLSLSRSLKLCSVEEEKALIIQILIKHSIGLGFPPHPKQNILAFKDQTSHTCLPKILKYMKRPEKSFLNPADNQHISYVKLIMHSDQKVCVYISPTPLCILSLPYV